MGKVLFLITFSAITFLGTQCRNNSSESETKGLDQLLSRRKHRRPLDGKLITDHDYKRKFRLDNESGPAPSVVRFYALQRDTQKSKSFDFPAVRIEAKVNPKKLFNGFLREVVSNKFRKDIVDSVRLSAEFAIFLTTADNIIDADLESIYPIGFSENVVTIIFGAQGYSKEFGSYHENFAFILVRNVNGFSKIPGRRILLANFNKYSPKENINPGSWGKERIFSIFRGFKS